MNQPQKPEAAAPAPPPVSDRPGVYRDTEQADLIRSNDTVHNGMNEEQIAALNAKEAQEREEFLKLQ